MKVLKELRESAKKTQKEVAKFLGVDRTTYTKYETGSSEPNFETTMKLAGYFNVSTDVLVGYGEKKEPTTEAGDGQGTGDAEFDAILKQLDRDDLELLKVQAALMAKRKQKK